MLTRGSLVFSIYVVGSVLEDAKTIRAWKPRDLDLLVFVEEDINPKLVKHGYATAFIVPHPRRTNGLLPTPLWTRPSALSTLLFIVEPKKLLVGKPIEGYLKSLNELFNEVDKDLMLWIEEKLYAYSIWMELEFYRNAVKVLARAIWGIVVAREKTLLGIRDALRRVGLCGSYLEELLGYENPSRESVEECYSFCEAYLQSIYSNKNFVLREKK